MYRLLLTVTVLLTLVGPAFAQTPTAAQADFNGNGEVEFNDFLLFTEKFNSRQGDDEYEKKYDLDGNGAVEFTDFLTFAGVFGETVPAWELTEIVPVEGMPGELIELVGRFDANTAYQVKFDTVLLPVYAQNAERITAMVPVLESGSVSVRVVDAAGGESAPRSFGVLALPEPRMNTGQLQQTVADVGEGIENVLTPLTEADVIYSEADAALFNREMARLNAAWDVLGERIATLPPEDAALLVHLLDNSGALGILEGLGKIDLSASKVVADTRFVEHHLFFRVDIVSALLGYASDVILVIAIAAAVAPEPVFTKAMTSALGGISTLIGVLKSGIDSTIPTDLQGVSKVEINPTPVLVGGASDVAFFGSFKTESNLFAELGAEGVGKGMEEIVKLFILKKKGKEFLDNDVVSNAVDEIVGFFSGILSDVGFDVTRLENLFEKVAIPRYDVPLDMSLYRLSAPSIIKWVIPSFPAEEIDEMVGVLEKVGIDVISESVDVVDGGDVVNSEVAAYDPAKVQLTGKEAGVMRLKIRAFRFVEPGGESGDKNKGFWSRLKGIIEIPVNFLKNLHPIFRFYNSMEHLEPVYLEFVVTKPFDAHFAGITYDNNNKEFYIVHDNPDGNGGKVYKSKKQADGSWEHEELFDLMTVPFLDPNQPAPRILLPTGITYDDSTIYVVGWVTENDENKIKVARYSSRSDGKWKHYRNEALPENSNVTGVTFLNNRFYTVDYDKVYVYHITENIDWGFLRSFNLDSKNSNPSGITYANEQFYVVDAVDDRVYAYTSSGQRDSDADFNLDSQNSDPSGITYANDRFYVVDDEDRGTIYEYELPSDLIVESLLVSDNILTVGQSFTLSAIVRNQGFARTPLTTLRYYRSTDAMFFTRDEVGTDYVGRLNREETSAETIELTAPPNPGTYYYGACVESVIGESDTDNNCSDAVGVVVNAGSGGVIVTIPDDSLRAVIADSLGKASGEAVTAAEMATLTRLEAPNSNISDLTGLEFATGLTYLGLGYEYTYTGGRLGWINSNEISNLSPLSGLPNLTWLDLGDTNISDVSALSGLPNLTVLRLGYNNISDEDVSVLSGLTNLTRLELYGNRISDVSALSGLPNLTWLDLGDNSISDVSVLSGLPNLTVLILYVNRISDVSVLSGLTNLTWLDLGNNRLSDEDMSVLSGLTNLTGLYLYNNSISDVSVLSGLTNLIWLRLGYNNISDVSALSGLSNLTGLRLGYNNISDLAPLIENTGLGKGDQVDVRVNPLSATSLNTHIPALQARGVTVQFGAFKPAVGKEEMPMPRAAMKMFGDDAWEKMVLFTTGGGQRGKM